MEAVPSAVRGLVGGCIVWSKYGSPGLTSGGPFTVGHGGVLRRAQESEGFQEILTLSQI